MKDEGSTHSSKDQGLARDGKQMESGITGSTGSTPMNHHSSSDQNPPVIPFNPGWFIKIPRSWITISTFSWVYHPRTSQPHLHVQVQAVEPCWSLGQVKVPGDGTYGKILWLMVLLGTSSINHLWLVVSTPLKNISQLGLLFPIYGKMFQTTNQIYKLVISL